MSQSGRKVRDLISEQSIRLTVAWTSSDEKVLKYSEVASHLFGFPHHAPLPALEVSAPENGPLRTEKKADWLDGEDHA
jgi:hypothetical protein